MALIKMGSLATEVRGSIAGVTFAKNRSGSYCRARTKPVNPKSERQDNIRSVVSAMRYIWAALSIAQRSAWALYAQNISVLNRVGESINLSGYNQFCRTNTILSYAGKSIVENAPIDFSLAEQDPTLSVTATVNNGLLSIGFDNLLPWASETGAYMVIYQGQPVGHTTNFFNGPWREVGSVAGVTGSAPTSPQTLAVSFPIGLGQKQVIKARIVRADGRASAAFTATCLVTGTPLVAPTAAGVYDAGVLTTTLTFPQNMNQNVLPAAGDFEVTSGDATHLAHTAGVWNSATELELTVTTGIDPTGTGTLEYIPGTIPLITAAGGVYAGFEVAEIVGGA